MRGTLGDVQQERLNDDEISQSQPAHLSDLLRPLPGVEVGGTHSVVQRINIRGLDDRDLTVFVDGIPQLNYLYHHVGNVLVNPDFLQYVEVQNGATSVRYGGLGGVVRFTTKDAKQFLGASARNIGGQASVTGGLNAPETVSGLVYGRFGRADALVYAGLIDRDDFDDGAGVKRRGVAGRTRNFAGKLGLDLSDVDRLEATYDRYEDQGDYIPRPDTGQAFNDIFFGSQLIPNDYRRENIAVSYQRATGTGLDVAATVFKSEVDLRRDERAIAPPFGEASLRYARSILSGADMRLASEIRVAGATHQFNYGGELSRQRLFYDSQFNLDGPTTRTRATRAALFAEDEVRITRALSAKAGLRWNRHEIEDGASIGARRWEDFTYSLGLELRPLDRLSIVANTTTLFKGPELPEPFTESGAVEVANSALEPETGRNTQLGVSYAGRLGPARIRLGVNGFQTRIKDYSVRADVPGSALRSRQTANIGDLGIRGVEAISELRVDRSAARLSYATASFDTDDLRLSEAVNAVDVQYGLREVGDSFGLEIEHVTRLGLGLSWNSDFVLKKRAFDGEAKDGYTVHAFSLRQPDLLGMPGVTLVVGVQNLFDTAYVSHASRTGGFTAPGLGFVSFADREPGRNLRLTLTKTL